MSTKFADKDFFDAYFIYSIRMEKMLGEESNQYKLPLISSSTSCV